MRSETGVFLHLPMKESRLKKTFFETVRAGGIDLHTKHAESSVLSKIHGTGLDELFYLAPSFSFLLKSPSRNSCAGRVRMEVGVACTCRKHSLCDWSEGAVSDELCAGHLL